MDEDNNEKTQLVQRKQQPQQPQQQPQQQQQQQYTVGEVMDKIGVGWFHVFAAGSGSLLLLGEAMGITMIGIIARDLQCTWRLPNMHLAIFSFSLFLGFLLFAPVWGLLADGNGRQFIVLVGTALTGYFMILSAASPNFWWLVSLRALVGAAMASTPQALVYTVETSPASSRALLVNASFIVWSLGSVLEMLLAVVCVNSDIAGLSSWRLLILLSSLPIVISCFGIAFLPESPRFCLLREGEEKCRRALRRVARLNRREHVIEDWSSLRLRADADVKDKQQQQQQQLQRLFNKQLRVTTISMATVTLLTNFTYYGVVLFTQQLVLSSSLGSSISGSTQLAAACGGSDCSPVTRREMLLLLLCASAELPSCAAALAISELLPRRRLLQLFSAASAACTLLLLLTRFVSSDVLLLLLLFCTRGAAVVGINVANLYSSEVFPTQVRSLGIGIVQVTGKCGSVLTPLIAQVVLPVSAIAGIGVYAAAAVAVLLITTFFLLKETGGQELEDS